MRVHKAIKKLKISGNNNLLWLRKCIKLTKLAIYICTRVYKIESFNNLQ